MKACWSGCRLLADPRPSSVVIFVSTTARAGVTQERTGFPSTSTVQAPHCAMPHPNLAALSSRSLRRTYSKGVSGAAATVRRRPLTVSVTAIVFPPWVGTWVGEGMAQLPAHLSRNPPHRISGGGRAWRSWLPGSTSRPAWYLEGHAHRARGIRYAGGRAADGRPRPGAVGPWPLLLRLRAPEHRRVGDLGRARHHAGGNGLREALPRGVDRPPARHPRCATGPARRGRAPGRGDRSRSLPGGRHRRRVGARGGQQPRRSIRHSLRLLRLLTLAHPFARASLAGRDEDRYAPLDEPAAVGRERVDLALAPALAHQPAAPRLEAGADSGILAGVARRAHRHRHRADARASRTAATAHASPGVDGRHLSSRGERRLGGDRAFSRVGVAARVHRIRKHGRSQSPAHGGAPAGGRAPRAAGRGCTSSERRSACFSSAPSRTESSSPGWRRSCTTAARAPPTSR